MAALTKGAADPPVEDYGTFHPSLKYDTLVLTSGSTKGIAAIGALHYLWLNYELKSIKNFMGVSVGAILGYLLAIGYSPIEIIISLCQSTILDDLAPFDFLNIGNDNGVVDWDVINKHLEKMTLDKAHQFLTFGEVREKYGHDFACVTFNAKTGLKEVLSAKTTPNLPCLIGIRMSCNIPILFGEFKYANGIYLDGCFGDNLPYEFFDTPFTRTLVLMLDSGLTYEESKKGVLSKLFYIAMIPILANTRHKMQEISQNPGLRDRILVINLLAEGLYFFDFNLNNHDKLEIFSRGYQTVKVIIENYRANAKPTQALPEPSGDSSETVSHET